jgi:hypothetical protein
VPSSGHSIPGMVGAKREVSHTICKVGGSVSTILWDMGGWGWKEKTMGWGGGWERGKGKGEGESEKEGKGWYLEHDLGDLDGVGGGAFAACADAGKGLRARDGVGDVGFVVGRVKVLAVPASSPARKAVVSINLGREIKGVHTLDTKYSSGCRSMARQGTLLYRAWHRHKGHCCRRQSRGRYSSGSTSGTLSHCHAFRAWWHRRLACGSPRTDEPSSE